MPTPVGKLRRELRPSLLLGSLSWLCVHAQAAGPAHLDSCGCGHSLCHPLLHIQVNSPVGKAAIVCERRLCHGVHGPVAGAVDHQAEDERDLQEERRCQLRWPRGSGAANEPQPRCPRRGRGARCSPTSRRRRRSRR